VVPGLPPASGLIEIVNDGSPPNHEHGPAQRRHLHLEQNGGSAPGHRGGRAGRGRPAGPPTCLWPGRASRSPPSAAGTASNCGQD
jgi:hypothetical protein